MGLIKWITPSPLIVSRGVNIDCLVYVLLLTVFNPILIWVVTYCTSGPIKIAIFVDLLWLIRYFNNQSKKTWAFWRKSNAKTILISGGSHGLGLAMVKKWNNRDDIEKIYVIDVNQGDLKLNDLKKVKFVAFDLFNNVDSLSNSIEFTDVDILVCNAGVRQHKGLLKLNDTDIETLVRVNYISHLGLIKKVLNKIDDLYRVHIVLMGSVLGFVGPKNLGLYSGSKSGLLNIYDSLLYEIKGNVSLSAIVPGQLSTRMFAEVNVGCEFLAPVVNHISLAERIIDLVDEGLSGQFVYPLYGRLLPVLRIMPWWLQRALRRFSKMDDI